MTGRFTVTRSHEIHCGHRVVGHDGKCAHLHGHSYVFEFEIGAAGPALDELGRVLDFGAIKTTLCLWRETNWDHRLLIWTEDPWLDRLLAIDPAV